MNDNWYKKIIGARTIKTGLATFLTALFCLALNLNPIFAILTAIVTIEPTAKASLKKAIVVCQQRLLGHYLQSYSHLYLGTNPLSHMH